MASGLLAMLKGRPEPDESPAAEIVVLRGELDTARRERDEFRQELFEANRHGAWLTIERQKLLTGLHAGQAAAPDQGAVPEDMSTYIASVEAAMFDLETERCELMRYVETLEAMVYDAETARVEALAAVPSGRAGPKSSSKPSRSSYPRRADLPERG